MSSEYLRLTYIVELLNRRTGKEKSFSNFDISPNFFLFHTIRAPQREPLVHNSAIQDIRQSPEIA